VNTLERDMTNDIKILHRSGQAPADPAWYERAAASADPSPLLCELKGGFAVAWRDGRGRCMAAVDRMGQHTLCISQGSPGHPRVAERADDLVDKGSEIDLQALHDYLYFHMIPSPRTAFAGVHRVPAGHLACLDGDKLSVQPFVRPAFQEPEQMSLADAKQEFLALLRKAVRRQLDGSKPACFLSGGTDSSTVAGLITEIAGQPAATYTIGFDAEGYDEMAFARMAARHFGCEHHEYYVTPDDLVRDIPRVAAFHDQPFGNSSALPAYHCALRAREQGITRLLAGDGGDELFGGNTRYATQELFRPYHALPQWLRQGMLEPFFAAGLVARTSAGLQPLAPPRTIRRTDAWFSRADRWRQHRTSAAAGLGSG
jgi:asparagine synthase (glutamine-hydrolysing)